nr:MAG TPA: hypothetical protein [Caudoviricetes sp.]
MKNPYTDFQANFIKHAEDAKRLLYGEFTYEEEDYKFFTEDGSVAYIIPKSMWWINDARAAQKGGEASQSTSDAILTEMKQCIPVRKIGTVMGTKGELVVLESYDKSLKLYEDSKKFKEFDKPDFWVEAYNPRGAMFVYWKGKPCAILYPVLPANAEDPS